MYVRFAVNDLSVPGTDRVYLFIYLFISQMGFSPSTHPRMQEVVREQTIAHPHASDEEALPHILEAIVNLGPSTSGTRHDD